MKYTKPCSDRVRAVAAAGLSNFTERGFSISKELGELRGSGDKALVAFDAEGAINRFSKVDNAS